MDGCGVFVLRERGCADKRAPKGSGSVTERGEERGEVLEGGGDEGIAAYKPYKLHHPYPCQDQHLAG